MNSDEIALEMMNTYSHWEQIELPVPSISVTSTTLSFLMT